MIAVNDDDTAHAVKIASSDGKMSLLMDQKDGALTIRYGDNSTKLTGAKAYELISTHKESSIWGNVYATVMGAEEKFNILEKLTTTVGASQTLNLGLNSVFNMGVNNVMNMGNNSATNLGNTQTIIGGSEAKLTVGASGDAGISKMMTFVQTVLI
jgi:hypothetical protein